MPRKIGSVSRSILVNAPLPTPTKSYTVISHSYAINTILKAMEDNNFQVVDEQYKCTTDAKVAFGAFRMDYEGDSDLGMVYSFSNSYDKTLRFRAAIGAQVNTNGAYMISDIDHWKRKHTGTADNETEVLINSHLSNANLYFDKLKEAKDNMMNIEITKGEFGQIVGELFFNGHLAIDQVSQIAKEYEAPSFKYTTGPNNLWTCYNHIIYALRASHPSNWMQNQVGVHLYFTSKYDLVKFDAEEEVTEEPTVEPETEETVLIDNEYLPTIPGILVGVEKLDDVVLPGFTPVETPVETPIEEVADPAQTNLLDAIEEAEKEKPKADGTTINFEVKEELQGSAEMYEEAKPKLLNTIAEDLKPEFIPEETTGEGNEENILPTEPETIEEAPAVEAFEGPQEPPQETNSDEFYFSCDDYPSIEIGDAFEVEGDYYEVARMEPVEGNFYLVCYKLGTPAEEISTPVMEISTPPAEELPLPTEAPAEIISPKVQEEELEDPMEDFQVEQPVAVADDPIRIAIRRELAELYGYEPEFSFTLVGDQYNIKLESGETITLPASYIESLI